jgi:hypothetical protein
LEVFLDFLDALPDEEQTTEQQDDLLTAHGPVIAGPKDVFDGEQRLFQLDDYPNEG